MEKNIIEPKMEEIQMFKDVSNTLKWNFLN